MVEIESTETVVNDQPSVELLCVRADFILKIRAK